MRDFGGPRNTDAVALESRLLEYFEPRPGRFSPRYEELAPPMSEPCWWALYRETIAGGEQHLDRAQLSHVNRTIVFRSRQ